MNKKLTGRPESSGLWVAGQLGREFSNASRKAELVPTLKHTGLNIFLVRVELFLLFIECFVRVDLLGGRDIHYSVRSFNVSRAVEMQSIVRVWVEQKRKKR